MKVLLTGGAGDLGQTLVPRLLNKGDTPVILDIRAPRDQKQEGMFIQGSILDRPALKEAVRGCDCIVHIAGRGAHGFWQMAQKNVERWPWRMVLTGAAHTLHGKPARSYTWAAS